MPRDDQIRDNPDANRETDTGGAQTLPVDFNEIRRQVALLRARRTALKKSLRETLTIDPVVEIELRDGKYRMEFTMRTALEFQKETGINLARGDLKEEDLQEDLGLLAKTIYYGLKSDPANADLTEEDVLDKLHIRRLHYYIACISDAVESILPDMALVQRLEMEMQEDPELLPFLQKSGGPGSGPSPEDY